MSTLSPSPHSVHIKKLTNMIKTYCMIKKKALIKMKRKKKRKDLASFSYGALFTF